jgi:hypothetical protein
MRGAGGKALEAGPAFPFLLLSLFAVYFGIGLSGYGNDNDTYGMLKTWADLTRSGSYSPSRPPGYLLPELCIGASAQAGGWAAANALSALLACGSLALFFHLLKRSCDAKTALLAVAAVGLNPHFIIAASSSMDYVYAAFFFLGGLAALDRDAPYGPYASAILFALCIASRLTYAPLVLLAYATAFLAASGAPHPAPGKRRKLAGGVLLFFALGAASYLPAWRSMGRAMFRPTVSDKPIALLGFDGFHGFAAYLVRFVYKNVSLWGLPAFAVLLAAVGIAFIRRRQAADALPAPSGPARTVTWAITLGILYAEILFLRLPLEIAYLLPVLFMVVFLLPKLSHAKFFLAAIALCHALQSVIQIDFLEKIYARKSYESVEASGVRLRMNVGAGVVWGDIGTRKEAQRHYFRSILGDSAGSEREAPGADPVSAPR